MTTCAICGYETAERFRFCPECGAPLAPVAAGRELRKVVTVVFCDVTGSTSLGERLDPESLRALLARYFERMREIVERHGGTVEKFVGDAVMAVFGVPVLHEDDALRATRAAAEMRDALPALGVQGRVGVTGEVVTGTEERLATGDVVNVAARLEQSAAPGEVLVGAETMRLVEDAVQAEEVAPLVLKGKAQPVSAYRLIAVRGEAEAAARHADSRPPAAAAAARGGVRERVRRPHLPPLHHPWRCRRREVAARVRVPLGHRRHGRARAVPLVRERDHLLAGRRGAGRAGRAVRKHQGSRGDREPARRRGPPELV